MELLVQDARTHAALWDSRLLANWHVSSKEEAYAEVAATLGIELPPIHSTLAKKYGTDVTTLTLAWSVAV